MKKSVFLAITLFCAAVPAYAQIPPVPTNLNVQVVPGSRPAVLLNWQVPTGPWHFKIYRADNDSTDFDPVGWSTMPAFEDHDVNFSRTYYYYVTTVNPAYVESQPSEIVHITVNSTRAHGHVSGTITADADSQPIPNVRISLFRIDNSQYRSAPAFTNLSGQFQVDVDTGTYFVNAEPPIGSPYRSEWYDNAQEPENAAPVEVDSGLTVVVDMGLASANPTTMAHVHGIVQSGDVRLRGARVVFMRTMQEMSFLAATTGHTPGLGDEERVIPFLGYTRGVIWDDTTDQFGGYYAFVPAGESYIAVAAKSGYMPQYFSHQSDPTQANIFTVRHDTSGINFDLSPNPDEENTIQGTIRDTTGQPVPSRVILFPKPPGTQPPVISTRFVHSDSIGNFQLGHILPGVYNVLAVPYSDFAASFYKQGSFGVIHWREADSIVASGQVSNIDVGVVSVLSSGLTRVTGSVTASNGIPVPGSRVVARTPDGWTVGSAVADESGSYAMDAVPVGQVTVYGDRNGFAAAQGTINIPPNTYLVNSNLILGGNGPTLVETGTRGPYSFELEQSYPNPFNPATTIRYTIPERSRVVLRVFDILGKEVATLVNEIQDAGSKSVRFDASGLASGMYFYSLEAGNFVEVKKTLLLK